MHKPTIKRYVTAIADPMNPFIIELRNFLPDDSDAIMWIEELREFGIITSSPADEQMVSKFNMMKKMAKNIGGQFEDNLMDKITEMESLISESGFSRYLLLVKQCYNAEEVRLYAESFRQDELNSDFTE